MTICDLCGQNKECRQREIERKEYDICQDCWNPLAQRLAGKGRTKKHREDVFLPPITTKPESQPEKPNPRPGEPPKIWGRSPRPS